MFVVGCFDFKLGIVSQIKQDESAAYSDKF